ncbi:MAG TPA: hypothetical protein VII76_02765 [Acidimicrobiales bacterium]
MRRMMRVLGWSVVVVGAAAAVAVVGRAVLGKVAGEPGTPPPQRGSFDNWPTVPPAPGRLVPNGSHVPTGS